MNKHFYVLSIDDLMKILNLDKERAIDYAKNFSYFYINNKMYISAEEFYGEKYIIDDCIEFENIDENNNIKIIKLLPKAYSVKDISKIFNCSIKQAYVIIKEIPFSFSLHNKLYVTNYDLQKWIELKISIYHK